MSSAQAIRDIVTDTFRQWGAKERYDLDTAQHGGVAKLALDGSGAAKPAEYWRSP